MMNSEIKKNQKKNQVTNVSLACFCHPTVENFDVSPEGDEKWPLFVNKQLFWWSASRTLDNNYVLTDF